MGVLSGLFKNVRGFSLAEVMVVAGMIGGLSLVFPHITRQLGEGKKEAKSVQDQIRLEREISLLLANKKHCSVSLEKIKDANNLDVPTIFKKADIIVPGQELDVELFTSDRTGINRSSRRFFPGKRLGKLTVESLKFTLDASTGNHIANQENLDLGNIAVAFSRKVNNKKRLKTIKFPIQVKVSTGPSPGLDSTLLTCESEGTAILGFTALSVTATGIAVDGSFRVGGASALVCSQAVEGTIRFVNTLGNKSMEYCNGTGWIKVGLPPSLTGSLSGIEVDGSVKFGMASTATCTAANKGAIRKHGTNPELEYCDATSWTVIGNSSHIVHAAGQDCFPHLGRNLENGVSCPAGYTLQYPFPHRMSSQVAGSNQLLVGINPNVFGRFGFCCK